VIGGFGRDDRFAYASSFAAGPVSITPSVLVEAGIQSGDHPVETRSIRSILSAYLEREGQSGIADDTGAFKLRCMHFRRTFVEKMFAIHGKVQRFRTDGVRIGRDSRHYADLFVLSQQPDVLQMLKAQEYEDIRRDYDHLSRRFFPATYRPPDGHRFKDSAALFPDDALRRELARDYDSDVSVLFFQGQFPAFADVLRSFEKLQQFL